jgi:hypothetical protein
MKKTGLSGMRGLLLASTAFAIVLGVTSCQKSPSAPATYSVSGTIYKTGVTNGVYAYLKLVASGGSSSSPTLYFTRSNPFSNGTATFSLGGIAAGNYTGYAFIDVNGNAMASAPMPDAGDYVTSASPQIAISGNMTNQDILDNSWVQY